MEQFEFRQQPPRILRHENVVELVVEQVTWRERARRWFHWAAWRIRPKFLKGKHGAIRLRWWICYQFIKRLDVAIVRDLALGRKLMGAHFEAGRSSPEFMRGKHLTMHARVLEARMLWLAYEGGAQFLDGSSRTELIHLAGMDIVRNPARAR